MFYGACKNEKQKQKKYLRADWKIEKEATNNSFLTRGIAGILLLVPIFGNICKEKDVFF